MTDMQTLTLVVNLVAVSVAIGIAALFRSRRKASRREALHRRLRNITFHGQANASRLIEFERTELKRKGRQDESLEDLMERATE